MSRERAEKKVRSVKGRRTVVRGWRAVDFRCSICRLVLDREELVDAAPDFDVWEDAEVDDTLDLWADDYGVENLDQDDRHLLDWPTA